MEKELKLVDNMKSNGLKMYNYWIVNGIYNFFSYLVTAALYFSFGRYVCKLDFFQDTHILLFIELFSCWGLCQVSLSMFFCSMFSSAQSAAMSGYAIAIWSCCLTSNITVAVFSVPRRLPEWMMFYPTFPFVRAMYLIIDPCTWETCYGDYDLAPPEFREMERWLILNSIVYLILALYLNEVLPQTYGVPKHPLFMFESVCKHYLPNVHNYVFGDMTHLTAFRDAKELNDEDTDVKRER